MKLIGNRLTFVSDAATLSACNSGSEFKDGAKLATEYTYDANGNMTKDLNKEIDIQYNVLNLPDKVTFSDGSTISYLYGANGVKLRTIHKIGSTTTTTDYCGNVVYENGVAKRLLTEEGYVSLSDRKYQYYLKDHQGNNQVVTDQNGEVEETSYYYPFGGIFLSTGSDVQPYKYNDKELNTEKGLNWYDYGARQYDAVLGRWNTVDPMAEKMYQWSPYTYCFDNPIKHIDEDGNIPWVAGLVGRAIDYGFQVLGNRFERKSWTQSLTDVNVQSIIVSAGTSMTGVGLGNVVNKGIALTKVAQASTKVGTVIKVAGEMAVDATMSVASQAINNGDVNAETAVLDVAVGKAAGIVGDKMKTSYQKSETGRLLYRQADHANRVAGSNPRASRAKKASTTTLKAQNYGEDAKVATSTAVSTFGNNIIDWWKKTDNN